MAQAVHRINLNATAFPLLSEKAGRSVFIKQYDQNYIPSASDTRDSSLDTGIIRTTYCHNVMPTLEGSVAVSYILAVSPHATELGFIRILPVRDADGHKCYLGFTSSGGVYRATDPYYVWTAVTTIATNKNVTTATIDGITYVYVEHTGCYKYDFSTNTLVSVTLSGLSISDISGICAIGGYMLAWGGSTVVWSSYLDPTDFTPSITSGAGGGSVQECKGAIYIIVPHTNGAVAYTEGNAISITYLQNVRYPFAFKEIIGAGGVASHKLVDEGGNHYAYTSYGLQEISTSSSKIIFPEITDFVSGNRFEDFDTITRQFLVTELSSPLKKEITVISSRYLVISYGITSLTHALVYDISLRRWGKLRVNHVDCFEFSLQSQESTEIPKRSIGFLDSSGAVRVVNFSDTSSYSEGVILIGKLQHIRQRMCQFDTFEVENVRRGLPFSAHVFSSPSGKDTVEITPTLISEDSLSKYYGVHSVGVNHSILLLGAFSLVCVEVSINVQGRM